MNSPVSVDNLASGIRELSKSGAGNAIELYLERELRGLPVEEKLSMVSELAEVFSDKGSRTRRDAGTEPADAARLLSLLLGDGIAAADLSNPEASEKLAQSLNTVFDALNQIICVIQSTLLGRQSEIETIRHVIGSQMGSGGGDTSLKMYLDQIQQAFLTSHKSFQEAGRSIVGEMLSALDPDVLAKEKNSGLKFGPLRKAELFESYQEKYLQCKKWFESGKFNERLLREFEKNCQKNYRGRI